MFAKNEKPSDVKPSATDPAPPLPKAPPSKVSDMPSVISADLEVFGDLKSVGDIQVDGKVKGDIRSRSVTVTNGATIEGSIYAESVIISGKVNGQVEAPKVSMHKTARVMGDIVHGSLAIESGAQFEGACRRLSSDASRRSGEASKSQPVKAA